jgi:hypothetical protein
VRPPDVLGAGDGEARWCAWRSRLPPPGARKRPDHDAALAQVLVHCPGAHACWSYWWLTLLHLRPIEGVRPAVVLSPGAGWEIVSAAQDPDHPPDPDDDATARWLRPIDWAVQFGEVTSDHEALRVFDAVVTGIMSGRVSPDSDFRAFWSRSIPATAKHHAEGGHPEH